MFAVWTKWLIRNLRAHYGGYWEETIIGTIRANSYKGGTFRDKLGVDFDADFVSFQQVRDITTKFFPKRIICSFYYMIGTMRLLIVNDSDLRFMGINITPELDGYIYLFVNLYNLSPPKIYSQEIQSQTSCVISLDSPTKNTRSARRLMNDSPTKNTRSAAKLLNESPAKKLPVRRRLEEGLLSPSEFF